MSEKRVVREETGPNGNVKAVVEDDGRTIYLYLEGNDAFGTRALWVRNRQKAPWLMEVERMQAGQAPMLQARYAADPEGGPPLDPEQLDFLWFEDGDGVALLEAGDVLAVIPPGTRGQGFAGFARDCALESPFASPLGSPRQNPVFAQLAAAYEFWTGWNEQSSAEVQEAQVRAWAPVGKLRQLWEVEGETWPPRAVALYGDDVLATVGMSVRPQPRVPEGAPRRVELALRLARGTDPLPLVRWLAGQATLPWDRYVSLNAGHSIGISVLGSGVPGMGLLASAPWLPDVHLPHYRDEHVELLWAAPLSSDEAALTGEALVQRLAASERLVKLPG